MTSFPQLTPWLPRVSIRMKLLSALLVLSLVPLSIVGGVAYQTTQVILKENAGAKLEELAAQTMDKIDRVLFSRSQDMQAWASMEALQDVITDDAEGRITLTLVRLWSEYRHEGAIYCLNQLGQIVASNEVSLIGRNVAREPWFQQGSRTDGPLITDLGYDPLTHTLAVRLMVPITAAHDDQTVIGYLAAHVPQGELQQILQQVRVHKEGGHTPTGHIVLVNNKGGLIAGPAFLVDAIPRPAFPSATLTQVGYVPSDGRPLSARGTYLTSDSRMLAGYARSSGYRTYAGLGWATLVVQDATEAFGQIKMLRREFLGLFVVTTLCVLLVAFAISRSISIPIQSLTGAANRIAAGDLSQTITVETEDEVGALATSFNRMTEDLRRSRDELVAANHELTRARDHAVEISELKSRFLANMSHEIRTPMNGILGMTEVMLATDLTDRQRRLLDTVARSGRSLLQIINDILDFSKVEAGKLELEHLPFDLRQVVTETVDMFTERVQRKGLTLTWTIEEKVPNALTGDHGRLRQILINLLGNAIKFTERGTVTLRFALQEETTRDVVVHCTVSDTGIGIPPEAQQTIFEPFSQADTSSTRRYGGTGLGLSIVKQLVTLMQGQITVQSEPGNGAQFTFTARFHKSTPQEASVRAASHAFARQAAGEAGRASLAVEDGGTPSLIRSPLPRARVLLAEDNEVNQQVARLMLEQLGQSVEVAGNGQAALEALARGSYDLILMDCQMPALDGFAATRALREREAQEPGRPRTPIVALTAHAIRGTEQECAAAGMDDYLSKPFTQEQLAAKLRHWLKEVSREAPHAIPPTGESPVAEASAPVVSPPTAPATLETEPPSQEFVDRKVWADIARLQQPGRPDVLVTMLSIFLKDSDHLVEQLQQAVERRDAKAVFELAHSLKSRSGVLGAIKLADLCRELEQTGRGGDLSTAAPQFDRVLTEFLGVSEFFRSELSRRSA